MLFAFLTQLHGTKLFGFQAFQAFKPDWLSNLIGFEAVLAINFIGLQAVMAFKPLVVAAKFKLNLDFVCAMWNTKVVLAVLAIKVQSVGLWHQW